MALPGFNNFGCLVTPIFLSRNRFYLQLHVSPHKNQCGNLKKIQDFSPPEGQQILPSKDCKESETVVAKRTLKLSGTSQVD